MPRSPRPRSSASTISIRQQLPHSNRTTSPLNPEYQLPSSLELPPVVPRFVRDGFTNDHIAGARPRRLIGDFRDSHHLNVHDTNNDGTFRTSRVTDPLKPIYRVPYIKCGA
jgi:hypothetical protein